DRKLKSLFPDTWEEWASMTPALMPKMDLNGKIFSRLDLRSWSLKKSLVANYEPVIVVYVLVWVFIVLQR
ncbi:MAG: hypothetical protein CMQ74_02355, partial [Gammaproteobacteria bacterium]|nr:hypothetical protein [Gammaproteobacteria bacterium]